MPPTRADMKDFSSMNGTLIRLYELLENHFQKLDRTLIPFLSEYAASFGRHKDTVKSMKDNIETIQTE